MWWVWLSGVASYLGGHVVINDFENA